MPRGRHATRGPGQSAGFSGEPGKVLAAPGSETTAVAPGVQVTVFLTFRGLNMLKALRSFDGKAIRERMIDRMTPAARS